MESERSRPDEAKELQSPPRRFPIRLRDFVSSLIVGAAFIPGSHSARAQSLSATNTTLTVSSGGRSEATITAGSPVTLTASVFAGGSPVTAGQVSFCDADALYCTDIHMLGMAQLTSAGTATFHFTPGVGLHNYRAKFYGSGADAPSFSNVSPLTVTGSIPTTVTIASSGSVGSYTLTATASGIGPIPPTGTVSFLDIDNDNFMLATVPVGGASNALGFVNTPSPLTGANPICIVVGDFNGDGKSDIAIANHTNSSVTVLLGNGDGTFTAAPSPATGGYPNSIAVGDFNGDGNLDLVTANGDNSLTVLLGNGDGSFTAAPSLTAGSRPQFAAVGDFNGDGNADLAVANAGDETVSILLGHGDGTFSAAASPGTGGFPTAIAIADLNGDGKSDLAVTNFYSNSITVLLGNGDGTFTPTTSPTTGPYPFFTAIADLNGDGKPDLATVSGAGNSVTILLGNGDGTFSPAASPSTGSNPQSIAVDDFNGDGIVDLITANTYDNTVTVLMGYGDGTFAPGLSLPTSSQPYSVAVGDFNGDGLADFTTANYGAAAATVYLAQLTQTVLTTTTGISPVGIATHLLEASYSGDGSYGSSLSSSIGVTAQPVQTSLNLNVTPSSSIYGQQILLTAMLSPYTAQGKTTDGELVDFNNGAINLGSAVLSHGVATLNVTALLPGMDSLSAAFLSTVDFGASTSNVVSFSVAAQHPILSFMVANHTYGDAAFPVSATSSSPGTIDYAVVSGPATLAGAVVTLIGAGTVILQATQAASGGYAQATTTASFSVAAQHPVLSFMVANHTYGDAAFPISATSNSPGTIDYAVVFGPATLDGAVVTLTGAGTVILQATQAASGGYAQATATASFSVAAEHPVLSFMVANHTYGDAAFPVSATSNSPATIDYAVVSGPATLSGAVVTLTGAGTVILQATQEASGDYAQATTITSFSVAAQHPILSFMVANHTYGDAAFPVSATSNSPATIDYAVVSGPATLSGAVVTLTGAGTVILQATQAASGGYAQATTTASFSVAAGLVFSAGGGGTTTIATGGAALYGFTLAPRVGSTFSEAVKLSVIGLPPGATYKFSPAGLTAGSCATEVVLTIQLAQPKSSSEPTAVAVSLGISVAGLLLPFSGLKRSSRFLWKRIVLGLLRLGIILIPMGCAIDLSRWEPVQTYTVGIVASSATFSESTTVTLTIQ